MMAISAVGFIDLLFPQTFWNQGLKNILVSSTPKLCNEKFADVQFSIILVKKEPYILSFTFDFQYHY